MEALEIIKHLSENLKIKKISEAANGFSYLEIPSDQVLATLIRCKEDAVLRFDILETIIATDERDFVFLNYVLSSTAFSHRFCIRTKVKGDDSMTSAEDIWVGARILEIEIWELFGIQFEWKKKAKHYFLPEDWAGFPLRKNFQYPDAFVGVDPKRSILRKEHQRS